METSCRVALNNRSKSHLLAAILKPKKIKRIPQNPGLEQISISDMTDDEFELFVQSVEVFPKPKDGLDEDSDWSY